jgi:hypothetical protein
MFTNSYRKINTIENYNNRNKIFDASHILFYSALLFFFMELILFYYAIIIAKTCSKNKDEFIINIILSIIFTTPYVFFSSLSNPCVKNIFEKNL